MKTKKIVVEVICFVLLMFWFYEGIYKVAYFHQFGLYIMHAPVVERVGFVLKYVIPLGEMGMAVLFFFVRYRRLALYSSIVVLIVFVLWIISFRYFTNKFIWPYYVLWRYPPPWMQKLLISIGLCWISFLAILLSAPKKAINSPQTNSLRNKPANASSR